MSMCIYRCGLVCHSGIERSEENLHGSVFSFHHVGPGDQTRVTELGRKCLYPLNCVTGPKSVPYTLVSFSTPITAPALLLCPLPTHYGTGDQTHSHSQ